MQCVSIVCSPFDLLLCFFRQFGIPSPLPILQATSLLRRSLCQFFSIPYLLHLFVRIMIDLVLHMVWRNIAIWSVASAAGTSLTAVGKGLLIPIITVLHVVSNSIFRTVMQMLTYKSHPCCSRLICYWPVPLQLNHHAMLIIGIAD